MKLARTGVTTVLALAAAAAIALLAIGTMGLTRSEAVDTGDIALVAIDTDTTGNTATSIGTVDECQQIASSAGTTHEIDVIVDSIPAFSAGHNGISGYQFDLNYDNTVFNVTAADNLQLIDANGGTTAFDFSDTLPDSDGTFTSSFADFGSADPEDGAGILTRFTLEVQAGAAAGPSNLTLTLVGQDEGIADANNDEYTITTIQDGRLAVGEACSEPPTATPTSGPPTDTPTPTPTDTGTVTESPTPTATPTGTAAATTAAATTAAATTAAASTATASPGALPPTGGAGDGSGLSAMLLLAAAAAALATVGAGAFAMSAARRED